MSNLKDTTWYFVNPLTPKSFAIILKLGSPFSTVILNSGLALANVQLNDDIVPGITAFPFGSSRLLFDIVNV